MSTKRIGISAVMIFVIFAAGLAAWVQERQRMWALHTLASAHASFDAWTTEVQPAPPGTAAADTEAEEEADDATESEIEDDGSIDTAAPLTPPKESDSQLALRFFNYPTVLTAAADDPGVASQAELGRAIRIISPRVLVLRSTGSIDPALMQHLGQVQRLRTLDLSGSRSLTDAHLASLKGLHRLRQIHLRGAPGITLRSLPVFTTWPNLKVLDLGGTGITGGDLQKVRQALPLVTVVE
ncbi:hypothetical protein [Prosthecobacter vanneervenii]|uniref:Leucine Rich repeats (2 copies) n=1 Tax=Prosthecobacter vanneervenii TaxID=48466 RepID=A0A7W8DIV2_9BACT|nr:hypothetical protein [Prosthecobacter vanneervenii]MBB5031458.1 hypothetical protein [Prosthecobacter vanneervenii]